MTAQSTTAPARLPLNRSVSGPLWTTLRTPNAIRRWVIGGALTLPAAALYLHWAVEVLRFAPLPAHELAATFGLGFGSPTLRHGTDDDDGFDRDAVGDMSARKVPTDSFAGESCGLHRSCRPQPRTDLKGESNRLVRDGVDRPAECGVVAQ